MKQKFCQIWGLHLKTNNNMIFHSTLLQRKIMTEFFETKTSFLGHVGLFLLEYRQMQKSAPLVFNILQLLNNLAIA